jgi:hypothetical protein
MTSNEKGIRRIAAVSLAIVGVIHLVLSPEYLDEETYIGALFIAGGLAGLVIAARLWVTTDRRAWSVGVLIAAGMFAGFVLSRTTGLPGFKEGEWELSGIVSLILEAVFMGAAARLRRPAARRRRVAAAVRADDRLGTGRA